MLIKDDFGIIVNGTMTWSEKNLTTAYIALSMINDKLHGKLKTMVDGTTFTMASQSQCSGKGGTKRDCYHGITTGSGITFYSSNSNLRIPVINFLHETGHLIDAVPATLDAFSSQIEGTPDWVEDGYVDDDILLDKFAEPVQAKPMNEPNDVEEYWADAFANYVAGNIDLQEFTGAGQEMFDFVSGALAPYINP